MREKPKSIEVEVLPASSGSITRFSGNRSLWRVIRVNLLTAPESEPIAAPAFDREELEASFPHRFGLSVMACWQGLQHYVSPSGEFTAFVKLALRWFLALLLVVVALGVPCLIAAQFIDSVMALFRSAMHSFMWGCFHLVGGLAALALLATVCVMFSSDSKK